MTVRLATRLAAVAVLAALMVFVALVGRGDPKVGAAQPLPAAAPQSPAGTITEPPPSRETAGSADPTAAAPNDAGPVDPVPPGNSIGDEVEVALQAVAAWQEETDEQRADALAAIATTAYQKAALTIDARRVPTAAPVEARTRVESDGQALVDVELENGSELAVLLVLTEDHWLVDDLGPVTVVGSGGGAP